MLEKVSETYQNDVSAKANVDSDGAFNDALFEDLKKNDCLNADQSSETYLESLRKLHISPSSLDDPLDFDLPWITDPSEESTSSPFSTATTTNDNEDVSSFVDEIEEDFNSLGSRDSLSPMNLRVIGTSAEWPVTRRMASSRTEECVDINNNQLATFRQRSLSFSEGSQLKKTARFDRNPIPWARNPKPSNLSYNTNLKKPPENLLRTRYTAMTPYHHHTSSWSKHTSPFYSYTYSKTSWAMFAFRYANRGRKSYHKGLATYIPCLCCGCCNCSRVNQTYCCCCYHCVHRVSACRRPDLNRIKPMPVRGKSASSIATPQLPSQQSLAPPTAKVEAAKGSLESETESGLESGGDSPIKRFDARKDSLLSGMSDDCGSLRF